MPYIRNKHATTLIAAIACHDQPGEFVVNVALSPVEVKR
jgi:hypothetical protein